jgi:hypothetical protein
MRRKKYYQVEWTDEKKEMVIKKITDFLERYGVGECIMQNDDAIIEAPEILSDIADILVEGEGIFYKD